ncbi:hypothetical protein [Rossellomorea aquimaris]|uniref:hypothetical protein n=1 Tax=Rossellomorea aquimaris TaxID=189382 RepID=UPI0037C535C7
MTREYCSGCPMKENNRTRRMIADFGIFKIPYRSPIKELPADGRRSRESLISMNDFHCLSE